MTRHAYPFTDRGALITGAYRYRLWRTWIAASPCLLWALLNPSTADEQTDDPTLRRCLGFSQAWGYGGLEMVNLFALRTPSPRLLKQAPDPIGSDNDAHIVRAAERASRVVVAWGADGGYRQRDQTVLRLLMQHVPTNLLCLGITRNGSPRHPLYVAAETSPVPFSWELGDRGAEVNAFDEAFRTAWP